MWTKEAYSVVVVVVVVVLLLTNVIWCNVKAGDHLHGNNNKQTKTTLMTWMRRCFLCKSSLRLPLRRYNYLLEIDRLIDCIFVSRLFADLCTFCFLWGFSSSLYRSADTQTVLDSKQERTRLSVFTYLQRPWTPLWTTSRWPWRCRKYSQPPQRPFPEDRGLPHPTDLSRTERENRILEKGIQLV